MHSVVQLLKRIFTMQTIGLMVAVGSLLVAIHQVLSDSDGEPVVSWNGAEMAPNSKVTTYVYTSTTEPIAVGNYRESYPTYGSGCECEVLRKGAGFDPGVLLRLQDADGYARYRYS